MKNKRVKEFLKDRGFKPHPTDKEKMIFPISDKGGIIVFGCAGLYEVILGYLPNGDTTPEFTFSGLDEESLIQEYPNIEKVIYMVYNQIVDAGY